jgi:hypothetical protein
VIKEERKTARRPARVGVLQAVRRYPAAAFGPLILLTVLGLALGYARPPTYTATAQVAVGTITVSDPAAVGSVVQATNSLAAVYARMINATGVKDRVRREVGDKASGASISANPLPGSPLIRVKGKADSASGAIAVANASASALLRYAERYDDTSTQTRRLYRRFRAAAARANRAAIQVRRAAVAYGRDPTRANKRRLNRATTDSDAARLLRDALRVNYQVSQQAAGSGPALRSFARADKASSDRYESMQVLGLLGLLAGGALGAAFATARLNRRLAQLTHP